MIVTRYVEWDNDLPCISNWKGRCAEGIGEAEYNVAVEAVMKNVKENGYNFKIK